MDRTAPQTQQSTEVLRNGTEQSLILNFPLIPHSQWGEEGKRLIFTKSNLPAVESVLTAMKPHSFIYSSLDPPPSPLPTLIGKSPCRYSPAECRGEGQLGAEPQRERGHGLSHGAMKHSPTHSWWRDLEGGADVGAARGVIRSFLKSSLVSLDLQGRKEQKSSFPKSSGGGAGPV